jgi:hypothetical protein
MTSLPLRKISFGGTSAIVSSMGLILGLNAAEGSRRIIIGALLIFALADNLADSLSVHAYQEAELLAQKDAFATTIANFATRLLISLSFVCLVVFSPTALLAYVAGTWGLALLTVLTIFLAKARGAAVLKEVSKHLLVAGLVIVTSHWIGTIIDVSIR